MNGDRLELIGAMLPKVPNPLIDLFDLHGIKHKHRHWVAKGKDGYYKLAPVGSVGQRHLRLEGELLQGFRHSNIVKGNLCSSDGWEILRTDSVDGDSLTKIRDNLSSAEKTQILAEIESAVLYINEKGILHSDVSASNILWNGNQSYLIDFEEAFRVAPPKGKLDSPDFIGGPPCCWGDVGYGANTYLCLASLRAWLFTPEFLDLKRELTNIGIWNPNSKGNTCEPWSTVDDGSVYQTITFGAERVPGQRDPDLRFRHLSATKKISFANKRVLDIGCNFGRLGAFLDTLEVLEYVGVDLSEEYINVARKIAVLEGRDKARFVAGDICAKETIDRLKTFSPDGYDIIICQSVYHHILDKELFWAQVAKLNNAWFVFEGPTDDGRYLLTGSWDEETQYIRGLGYENIWQSEDNDFRWRILTLFEKIGDAGVESV
jgi:SAM-dependent methyltransferase